MEVMFMCVSKFVQELDFYSGPSQNPGFLIRKQALFLGVNSGFRMFIWSPARGIINLPIKWAGYQSVREGMKN